MSRLIHVRPNARDGIGSLPRAVRRHVGEDEIHCVTHGLEVCKILVLDAKSDSSLAQLFFESVDEFDESKRVGIEVVLERLPFADACRVDFENVDELVANDVKDRLAVERSIDDMGFCGHEILRIR